MIEIRNLTKRFGAHTAVDDLSFQVAPGEVLGFLGPNGAGKSTTMKMVTGFLPPTSGTAVVCGHDVLEDPRAVKASTGYLPEGAPLYPDMTPLALLRFAAEARGVPARERRARIDDAVRRVHLEEVLGQRIETLSKGFKRRVGLALAILHDPPVLVLDEPTDGLDPNQKHDVRRLIRDMAPGKVIVLSTHILEEVEAVCTRAIIVSEGRLCFDGTPTELRRRSSYRDAVEIGLAGVEAGAARARLEGLAEVARVEDVESFGGDETVRLRAYPTNGARLVQAVHGLATEAGWEVAEMHVDRGRMDDVFRDITTGRGAAGAADPVGGPMARVGANDGEESA